VVAKMLNLQDYLREKATLIDGRLEHLLPSADEVPSSVHRAMRYSVFAGGKRLRPILSLTTNELVSGKESRILDVACALEMIHAYSLIHDDLPCMDDDDFRRGRPSLHKAFNEGLAVLAGDSLHALAFEILVEKAPSHLVVEVAQAIGSKGMIGGQVLDLESEGKQLTPGEVEYIHQRKTGFLIRTSVRAGAICGGVEEKQLAALTRYGEKIGLAFQIIDDILDVEGCTEELGKKVGADERREKVTYPKVFGLDDSREMAEKLIEEAKADLVLFGPDGQILCQIADFIVQRMK
jgi:geranylgeranyl diphosphate synthase type II